jgi:hypothetical protein
MHEKPNGRTGANAIGELDTEMNKILLQKAEDSEKWKMYNQTLQRYLHFVNEQRKPLEISVTSVTDAPSNTFSASNDDNARLMSQLTAIVPQKFKHNATALFESLRSQQAKAQIKWDGTGSVNIQNTPLSHTNIVELISDATRNRKTAQAVGWKEFATALKQLNTPLDLISNSEYKKFISSQSGNGNITVIGATRKANLDARHPLRFNTNMFTRVLRPQSKQPGRVIKRRADPPMRWSTHWSPL